MRCFDKNYKKDCDTFLGIYPNQWMCRFLNEWFKNMVLTKIIKTKKL